MADHFFEETDRKVKQAVERYNQRILKQRMRLRAYDLLLSGQTTGSKLYLHLRAERDRLLGSLLWFTKKNRKRIEDLGDYMDYLVDNIVDNIEDNLVDSVSDGTNSRTES